MSIEGDYPDSYKKRIDKKIEELKEYANKYQELGWGFAFQGSDPLEFGNGTIKVVGKVNERIHGQFWEVDYEKPIEVLKDIIDNMSQDMRRGRKSV